MIDKKYSKNYIKIYFWKSLTITSGLLSLFIVIPFLSKDQEHLILFIMQVDILLQILG